MSTRKSLKKQLWNPHCNWVVQITNKSSKWLQSWSPGGPEIHQKSTKIQVWSPRCPSKFQPLSGTLKKPDKVTPGSPKASQNEAQSLPRTPKTQTFPHPGIASWCHVHSQTTKKSTLESVLQLGGPNYEKVTNMNPKLVPRGPKIHQTSTKTCLSKWTGSAFKVFKKYK